MFVPILYVFFEKSNSEKTKHRQMLGRERTTENASLLLNCFVELLPKDFANFFNKSDTFLEQV